MSIFAGLLRRTIMWIDGLLRRYYGVWEFTQDPECIFRISVGRSPVTMTLADGFELRQGDPVGVIHMWNERVQQIAAPGSALGTARVFLRRTLASLRLCAAYAQSDPRLRDAVAFGGETGMFSAQALGRPEDMLGRFGMTYAPLASVASPTARLQRFFERFYTWLLMWTFNPETLRGKTFADVGRGQAWMSRARLMAYSGKRSASSAASAHGGEM